MINSDTIKKLASEKPVAIFGAGVSGIAAKKLLDKIGVASEIYAEDLGAIFDETQAKKHALVVYSPAFHPDNDWMSIANKNGLECICETDLSSLAWCGKIIAITGTNGKTTLTKFITYALNFVGRKAIAVGNVGTPLSEICAQENFDKNTIAVYELSSFQTLNLKYLKPDAVIWTNFDSDHLDWHKDLQEYFRAKLNLANALSTDVFIAGSSVEMFAKKLQIALPQCAKIFDEKNPPTAPEPFSSKIQSKNYLAAKLLWNELGLDASILEKACANFQLPKFRFSTPEKIGEVNFFNDSKATNAHAAIAAIEELSKSDNLIWLGGGKDKQCDLSELVECIAKHCKSAVLIGQTAEKLQNLLSEKNVKSFKAETMQQAVEMCFELASPAGDVIFSPAFSSFGMFAGYAERGKSFDDAVLCLKNSKKM